VLAVITALTVPATTGRTEEPKAGSKEENKLIGTWKLVSAKWGGQERKLEGLTVLKHVTPAQFIWVRYDKDGNIKHAMGGGFTLKGEDYEETTEYGTSSGDFTAMKGKVHTFKLKVDGNKLHQTGKLSGGLTIEEVWERVEKK
jgi:hypothetical protein